MPLGIVSDKDFEKELGNSSKVPDTIPTTGRVDILPTPGRNSGDNNVPDSLRKIIGETSEIEGRQEALELANHFGISPSSVSAYANGSTSTASMDKQPNLDHINGQKNRIVKRATIKLHKALSHITDEKLEGAKAVDLASIAKSMSGIVKEMEPEKPKDSTDGKNAPAFIVYSPTFKQENYYEVVTARE